MSGPIKDFQADSVTPYLLVDETPTDQSDVVLQPGQRIVIVAQRMTFVLVKANHESYLIDNETLVAPVTPE